FRSFCSDPDRPFHKSIGSYLCFPIGTDLTQVICKVECCSRTVVSMNNRDPQIRQWQTRIQGLNGLVIPFGNSAQENSRKCIAIQDQLARFHIRYVHDWSDSDNNDWKLN